MHRALYTLERWRASTVYPAAQHMAIPSRMLPSRGLAAFSSGTAARVSHVTPQTASKKPSHMRRPAYSRRATKATAATRSGSRDVIMPACEAVVRRSAWVSNRKKRQGSHRAMSVSVPRLPCSLSSRQRRGHSGKKNNAGHKHAPCHGLQGGQGCQGDAQHDKGGAPKGHGCQQGRVGQ